MKVDDPSFWGTKDIYRSGGTGFALDLFTEMYAITLILIYVQVWPHFDCVERMLANWTEKKKKEEKPNEFDS